MSDTNILGDGIKKSRFNKDLANKMNKEAEKKTKKKIVENIAPISETLFNPNDYILLESIVCRDANNDVFEAYDKVYVAKDVERIYASNGRWAHGCFTSFGAVQHFEKSLDCCLPSFALTCNILEALHKRVIANPEDTDARSILLQYKERGDEFGSQVTNTLIDWKNKKIIHYPNIVHYNELSSKEVNLNRRTTRLEFNPIFFGSGELGFGKDALEYNYYQFLRNLTGLETTTTLLNIAKFLGSELKVYMPDNPAQASYTAMTTIGVDMKGTSELMPYFSITVDCLLDYPTAARGVRLYNNSTKNRGSQ